MEFGTDPTPTGLADPTIDQLLEHVDSNKYSLSIFAAKRARQINSYFTQLNEGLLQNVGPLVEYKNQEKPLSIAFREIDSGLLEETLAQDDLSEGN
ncbi:DNA-directed RNA polymerase subunit omega [Bifidobacterium bombi]|uniref:DNA-directed RNA polymerase subunit omega n=1 Tax=Bifidobacterium bombi DSM 19703 TaxID=1341695 RepID=A0A086BNX3_9BIFI|nr:DNA-directed RNA polymerase subunit omega [Bifidobacterium bombi]KFF30637.1 DNA-directed RNA polymerase, omega subunit [Bifidobacterium bombi DSM 19703]